MIFQTYLNWIGFKLHLVNFAEVVPQQQDFTFSKS